MLGWMKGAYGVYAFGILKGWRLCMAIGYGNMEMKKEMVAELELELCSDWIPGRMYM